MTRVGLMVGAGLVALCGAAQAQQGRQTVDPALCRALTRHQPAPDVAYKPGVDVKGRAVAPADLPGSAGSSLSTERFEIPLTLDLARRLGVKVPTAGLPTAGLPGAMEIGRMTLDGGRLLLNGQPLGGASEAELVALCRGR